MPKGLGLLLSRLEHALLQDRLAHAVREPAFRRRPPALAQAQQERPFEIVSTRLAQRRHLPLGREVMEAQALQLAGERRVLTSGSGHARHGGPSPGPPPEYP